MLINCKHASYIIRPHFLLKEMRADLLLGPEAHLVIRMGRSKPPHLHIMLGECRRSHCCAFGCNVADGLHKTFDLFVGRRIVSGEITAPRHELCVARACFYRYVDARRRFPKKTPPWIASSPVRTVMRNSSCFAARNAKSDHVVSAKR